VRAAFNSPFWPLALTTTSVGQEGLDCHAYSHAVVPWNLPTNPVDLEQREGRIHRYKGHAVRKNVARVPEAVDVAPLARRPPSEAEKRAAGNGGRKPPERCEASTAGISSGRY
jgi:hypothetical protein